ncbi:MAG: adenylate/guanylate cyclase domain-containing protein [Clostridia bacterium]|nr:adenylate/guanylate cyclase domain-containing protein [Clostridia bacterium]MDD4686119.1 adenylate/guanylate cyclase domain-containing protein [Clostridia bacterium]
MKTSTKIWIVIFIISLVLSLLLGGAVSQGIILENGISFNFSVLGYVGLIFVIINFISSNILFFRFLTAQPFSRLLFFITVPVTAFSAIICFYLINLNTIQNPQVEYVRQVLNVSPTNNNNYLWLAIIVIAYLLILFISFKFACKPIKKVEDAVRRLSNGRVPGEIQIGGSKQFSEIENGLNKINVNYKEKENLIKKTNLEYEKYIPKQFLKFLGKSSILELELGNQVQREVTTMFVDIHHSTQTSTTLSLEENFNYINSYLNVVSPIIRKFNGFVDKYLGDGILAVFAKPENALECSVSIVKAVDIKNKSMKNLPNLEVGISINTGEVVFGIVGEEERKSPTIISDAVNFASKMNDFNKYFGSKIIFSKRTLNSLKIDYPLSYRYVGTLSFEDDKEFVSLFESLDHHERKKRDKMENDKTQFEQAVRFFNLGKCHQAKEIFQTILKNTRGDKVAYMYYNRCEQDVCGEAPLRI